MAVKLYSRVSTREQEKGENLETHRKAVRGWVREQGLEAQGEVWERDPGDLAELEGLQGILREVQTGQNAWDTLVTYEFERLGRDMIEVQLNVRFLRKKGIRIVGVRDSLDTARFAGIGGAEDLLIAAKAWKAENERETTLSRTYDAKMRRLRDGLHVITTAPYGTRKVGYKKDSRLEINPDEQRVILEAKRHLEAGKSILATIKALNGLGLRTRTGAEWKVSTLRAVLENPALKGQFTYNRWAGGGKVKRKGYEGPKFKPEDEWIIIPGPAILSEEEFTHLQRLLVLRNVKQTPRNGDFALSGRVRCHCTPKTWAMSPLWFTRNTRGKRYATRMYRCQSCRKSQNAGRLEDWAWYVVWGYLARPESMRLALEERNARLRAGAADTKRALERSRAELARLQKERQKVIYLFRTEVIGEVDVAPQLKELDGAAQTVKAELARLEERYERSLGASLIVPEVDIEVGASSPTPPGEVLIQIFDTLDVRVEVIKGQPKVRVCVLE